MKHSIDDRQGEDFQIEHYRNRTHKVQISLFEEKVVKFKTVWVKVSGCYSEVILRQENSFLLCFLFWILSLHDSINQSQFYPLEREWKCWLLFEMPQESILYKCQDKKVFLKVVLYNLKLNLNFE